MSADLFDCLMETIFTEKKPEKPRIYHEQLNNYEIFKAFEQKRNEAFKDNRLMTQILDFVGCKDLSSSIYKELMHRGIVKKEGVCYVLDGKYEGIYGQTYVKYRGGNKAHRAINWYFKGFDLILGMVRDRVKRPLTINLEMKF